MQALSSRFREKLLALLRQAFADGKLEFVKIRHFGFLANRNRAAALALCRGLLKPSADRSVSILTAEQRSAVERR